MQKETEFGKCLLSLSSESSHLLSIILPVILFGCGTWSLTLREECRFRVFENRVLRRTFVPHKGRSDRSLGKTA
jgi:hypothetical protein